MLPWGRRLTATADWKRKKKTSVDLAAASATSRDLIGSLESRQPIGGKLPVDVSQLVLVMGCGSGWTNHLPTQPLDRTPPRPPPPTFHRPHGRFGFLGPRRPGFWFWMLVEGFLVKQDHHGGHTDNVFAVFIVCLGYGLRIFFLLSCFSTLFSIFPIFLAVEIRIKSGPFKAHDDVAANNQL